MGKGATLLVGASGAAWHAWLQENRKGRDLIVLDPADAHHGPGGRFRLLRGSKVTGSHFYGSLDPQRAPHVLMAAAVALSDAADPEPLIQTFAYRPTPLLRQTLLELAFIVRPATILIARDTMIDLDGWPIGPELVEVPSGLPSLIVEAQRKAQWLKMIEAGQVHEISLAKTSIQGVRLGSGTVLDEGLRQRLGLDHVLRAEVCGTTLLIIAERDPEEHVISRALDHTHSSRAQIVHPSDYDHLICAMVRPSGDCFGHGRIAAIDFRAGVARVMADAVAPVPVPILRIGSLRVDENGRELGEAKPWSV